MKFLLTGTMPIMSALEFARKSIEESTSDLKDEYSTRTAYCRLGGDGVILYIIFDVDKDRVEEALSRIQARAVRYGLVVEGMKWDLVPIYGIEEAITWLTQVKSPE